MKKFKLAGCTWTISEGDITELGFTSPDDFKIVINKKLDKQAKEVTLWHEIVHAIMFTMGEVNHDERFVEGMAQLLYQYEQQKV